MDEKQNNPLTEEDQLWLDELLGESQNQTNQSQTELGPDEEAVYQAGLTHPEDAELEKILAEDWSSVPAEATEEEPAAGFPAEFSGDAYETEQEVEAQEDPDSMTVPQKEPEQPATAKEPVRKGRPKMKKGYGLLGIPHILATGVWLALIIAIGVSLGRVIWVCCADIMAFGKKSQDVTITITDQDDIESISQKLANANLIRYPGLFKLFAELTGKEENISVGTFTLNAHLDYNAMINNMVYYGPSREEVDVMFPEGYSCAQIFALLEKNNVCTVAELEAYAAEGELDDYWFLEGVPRGHKYCLEGYLAPDTYTFYTNDEPGRVLEKFLDEFDSRFTDRMHEDFINLQARYASMMAANGYDEAYIQENALTLHQVVTLASIVSRETSSDSESYQIASVFYNRLTNPNFLYLNSNATVHYAIEDYFGEVDKLTEEDLNVDSPYNTHNHKGLPPGAICNPGVFSLYAALKPDETNYYYFVYDYDTYKHIFTRTYDEYMHYVNSMG